LRGHLGRARGEIEKLKTAGNECKLRMLGAEARYTVDIYPKLDARAARPLSGANFVVLYGGG